MVVIARRFCGPPDSGNGGYSAGLLAQSLDGAIEVTLRRPPPLERELALVTRAERVELVDGNELVAEARPTALELAAPAAPTFEQATELSKHYDERFSRMWRFYLACSAAVFRSRRDQLWQLTLSPNGVPGGYRVPR